MEDYYDVIIIGAGPAGLRAAEILKNSNLNILVLEKKSVIGPKICAAGITKKLLEVMDVPEEVCELGIKKSALHSLKRLHTNKFPQPVMYTVDRKIFGQWQLSKLKDAKNITVKTGVQVTKVEKGKIEVNREKSVKYKYLVGADGINSIVRRYLNLPVKNVLATIQYRVPYDGTKVERDIVQIFLISKFFHTGYAWIFPHNDYFFVGCAVNPKMYNIKKLKKGFNEWAKLNNIDLSKGIYESFPISYDFKGNEFGNIFLVGEAAGMASGLTGEGIYQAIVSGEEIAKKILNPDYEQPLLKKVLKYNSIQNKMVKVFKYLGPARESVFNFIIYLLKKGGEKNFLAKNFSKA